MQYAATETHHHIGVVHDMILPYTAKYRSAFHCLRVCTFPCHRIPCLSPQVALGRLCAESNIVLENLELLCRNNAPIRYPAL